MANIITHQQRHTEYSSEEAEAFIATNYPGFGSRWREAFNLERVNSDGDPVYSLAISFDNHSNCYGYRGARSFAVGNRKPDLSRYDTQ